MKFRALFASFVSLALSASLANAQIVRSGSLRPADRERLLAVGGEAARHWLVDAQAASGAVTALRGTIELAPGTPEERFADAVRKVGSVFGLGDGAPGAPALAPVAVLTRHPSGAPRHLRATQTFQGFEVAGHGLTVELDARGRAVFLHGVVSEPAARLAAPALGEAEALAIAQARFASRGFAPGDFLASPRVYRKRIEFSSGSPIPTYRVGGVARTGFSPLAIDVDARTGAVLREFEDKASCAGGEGTFLVNNGQNGIAFGTGNGKGVVFKDFKSAAIAKPALQPLPELAFETAAPGLAEDGTLFGRFAWVLNALDEQLTQFSVIPGANHGFFGFPGSDAQLADLFDAVNCYFHLTKFALGMTKLVGQTLPTDFSMPTAVNLPNELNAFFSPQDLGLGTGPGFMAFGDLSFSTGFLPDDFARDPTVMCHEYLHAIATFVGLLFLDADLNNPSRAVNEAIADYFAASFFKDARIGLPLAATCSNQLFNAMGLANDGLRNLERPLTMLDNLFDETVSGVPEEHIAGWIFGCTLWRFEKTLKQSTARPIVFFSTFNWPQSTAEVGFPTVDNTNAADAYVAYYATCLATLFEDTESAKGIKTALKGLGAMLVNGGIGCADIGTTLSIDATAGGSFGFDSAFLGTTSGHVILLALNQGQTLDVTVAGNGKDNTKPDLSFSGPPGGLSFTKPKTTSSNGLVVSQKGILVNTSSNYALFVDNTGLGSFTPRKYKLTIKAN